MKGELEWARLFIFMFQLDTRAIALEGRGMHQVMQQLNQDANDKLCIDGTTLGNSCYVAVLLVPLPLLHCRRKGRSRVLVLDAYAAAGLTYAERAHILDPLIIFLFLRVAPGSAALA